MSPPRGLVADTIPFSVVDGPGNRFVVFLQGCNFDCVACHNPWTIGVCTSCGECLTACPSGALSRTVDGTVRWDAARCEGTDRCLDVCPENATPKARWVTPGSLADEVRGPAPFLSGVTVSGGEATEQASFVEAFFRQLAHDPDLARLSRLVDSNGSAPLPVWERLVPVMDGAMIDLKSLDPDVHLALTGRPNDAVLASIRYLHEVDRLAEVRLLVLPGRNDDPDLVARTGAFLAAIDPKVPVRVQGFRCHGVRPAGRAIPEPTTDHLADVTDRLRAEGLEQLLTV